MIINLLYFIVLIIIGFLLSLPVFINISKGQTEYKISKDPWVYMWALSLFICLLLYAFLPDFMDNINEINYIHICTVFGLSALIYIAFLFEIKWLFYCMMIFSSAVISYLIPRDILIFEGQLPFLYDRLVVFAIVLIITAFSKILNGMSSIFGIFMLTGLCGLSLISLMSGVPLLFGCVAVTIAGVWLGFLRYNWYPSEIILNDGACVSAGFLLASFFLFCSCEYAGPSVLILCSYLGAEVIWVVVRTYILRYKEIELYQNTAYFLSYTRDISVPAIEIAIVKISLLNVIFACFQLYAPNAFSIPIFSFVVNLWLLNMLYHAADEEVSLQEANKMFIDNVKDNLKTISDSIKKEK